MCDLATLSVPASLCVYLLLFLIPTDFILYNVSFLFTQLLLLPNSSCILLLAHGLSPSLYLSMVLTSALDTHCLIFSYVILLMLLRVRIWFLFSSLSSHSQPVGQCFKECGVCVYVCINRTVPLAEVMFRATSLERTQIMVKIITSNKTVYSSRQRHNF